jgi:hypothetical protein
LSTQAGTVAFAAPLLAAFLCAANVVADEPPRLGRLTCLKSEPRSGEAAGGNMRVLLRLDAVPADTAGRAHALRMAVQRGRPAGRLLIAGSCTFADKANLDAAGRRIFPAAPDDRGFLCDLEPSGEGGRLLLGFAANARAATLFLPRSLAGGRGSEAGASPITIELRESERVQRLANVYPENCSGLPAPPAR